MSVLDFVVFGSGLFYLSLVVFAVAPWLFADDRTVQEQENQIAHGAGLSLMFR